MLSDAELAKIRERLEATRLDQGWGLCWQDEGILIMCGAPRAERKPADPTQHAVLCWLEDARRDELALLDEIERMRLGAGA